MAEADWTFMTNVLDPTTVDRGVTSGITPPAGGGSFVFGFNSRVVASGAVALFANQANFAPMASGGAVSGAIQRITGGGKTGWSAFLFIGASTNDMLSAQGYMLGLSDDDPSHIVLRKGSLVEGIPSGSPAPSTNGILLRSSASVPLDTWVHLRLEMVVNGTGDVALNVFQQSPIVSVATDPSSTIAGMTTTPNPNGFLDDALGINSGSVPFTSGRAGKAFECSDVTRRAAFDHVRVIRQL